MGCIGKDQRPIGIRGRGCRQFQTPISRTGRSQGRDQKGNESDLPKRGGVRLHWAIIIEDVPTYECAKPMKIITPSLRRSLQRGFTLIELMVVLLIIGVLAALIVPNVLDRADDARVTAAKTDVNNLMQALKLYKLDNQRYPTTEQGLQALLTKPTTGPAAMNWKTYLDKLPNDPWGKAYVYLSPGIKGEVDVMSFGADGVAGGEGKDADIGSWQP